ncbi:MAG: hypothetical protein Q8K75_05730 [Chlamydiales bacterium]|nr:hypothetical protein [Chlamydiales bacterium]
MRLLISLFLASMMLLNTPSANAEVQADYSGQHGSNIMHSLRTLSDQEPDTMRVLYNKAKDPSITLSSQHSQALKKYGLLNNDGEIPSHVQNLLLSNVDEDEDSGELYINGPSENYSDYNETEENYYPEGGYYQGGGYYPEGGGDVYYEGDGGYWDGDRRWEHRGDWDRHGDRWDHHGDRWDHRGEHRGDHHRGEHHGEHRGSHHSSHHSSHGHHGGGGHRR